MDLMGPITRPAATLGCFGKAIREAVVLKPEDHGVGSYEYAGAPGVDVRHVMAPEELFVYVDVGLLWSSIITAGTPILDNITMLSEIIHDLGDLTVLRSSGLAAKPRGGIFEHDGTFLMQYEIADELER